MSSRTNRRSYTRKLWTQGIGARAPSAIWEVYHTSLDFQRGKDDLILVTDGDYFIIDETNHFFSDLGPVKSIAFIDKVGRQIRRRRRNVDVQGAQVHLLQH